MAAILSRAFLPSNVRRLVAAPSPVIQAQAADTKAATAQLVSHGFSDNMEWAMTGLIFTGVLLFGAGMLHFAVPPCAVRNFGVAGLYVLAGGMAAGTSFAACRGVWHLIRG
jgi:hypothetical protein